MLIKFGMNYPRSGECRSREWIFKHALGTYIGFTEQEVLALCKKSGSDFGQMKEWYGGYIIHLGYFAYDKNTKEAYVPNKEIQEFFSLYGKQQI